MADSVRLIKKYPNRRLYDTQTSSYITLADVKELVLKHEDFQVIDAKSGDDLTRSILLQIILEEEAGGQPMFSSRPAVAVHPLLRQRDAGHDGHLPRAERAGLHRDAEAGCRSSRGSSCGDNSKINEELWTQFMTFQGPAMQSLMSAYMDQSKKMFQQMQEQLQTQTRSMFTGFPFNPFRRSAPRPKAARRRRGQEARRPGLILLRA